MLVQGNPTLHKVTNDISKITENETPKKWYIALGITSSIMLVLLAMLTYLVSTGIGVWGNNSPVGWAWDITNFVFWIGIGHAGTLISAILVPVPAEVAHFDQPRRRSDDAVRGGLRRHLSAVPHRPSVARSLLAVPMPNPDLTIWQNFRSPLIWDVFAVSTYATVSVLFWFIGLVPDLATLRDRAQWTSSEGFRHSSASAGAGRPGTGATTKRPT